tara:strand:+ start:261 stop:620 length:360 start_codon:yes stop_codon:yes gene_type:complete
MASRGRGARAKGANFERWTANYLSENTSLEARRGLAQTRGGGAEVSDVEIDYIHIEAKRHKRCNIKAALNQAINDCAANGKLPVAITKDDRQEVLCTMLLTDWVKLFKSYILEQEKINE